MLNQNQNYIVDHVGADWETVVEEFTGKTLEQIKAVLDYLFPHDDNDDLAGKIHDELN